MHRFYQEQYQLDGGKQDRYVTGSDAVGLTWATTTPSSCRSTGTCTRTGAPNYVIADHFFQAAFGGSFLNHQCLIAARAPLDTSRTPAGATPAELRARRQRDAERSYPLYTPTGDRSTTAS